MREVAQKKKGVVFRQTPGVLKIPQLKANILHCDPLQTNRLISSSTNFRRNLNHRLRQEKNKNYTSAMTHGRHFVSVENKSYAATAVVQMAAVWLALGGCLRRRGSSHRTNPPLITGVREAGVVVVLQTLLSGWAGLLSRLLV